MAYEKQTWEDGNIITAEKLNHMEDGIENSSASGETPIEVVFTKASDGTVTQETSYKGSEIYSQRNTKKIIGILKDNGDNSRLESVQFKMISNRGPYGMAFVFVNLIPVAPPTDGAYSAGDFKLEVVRLSYNDTSVNYTSANLSIS